VSAHGRPEALTPERGGAKGCRMSAHGRPETLTPERGGAEAAS
jgi:hypothetical protein